MYATWASRWVFVKNPSDRCTSPTNSVKTGRSARRIWARSGDLAAFRFRCSALAWVSLSSFVSAFVKWLPPRATGRCQMILPPSVIMRFEASVPMSRMTAHRRLPLGVSSASPGPTGTPSASMPSGPPFLSTS